MVEAAGEIAIFTKSYIGDAALCRRLCASIDRHMPEIRHYLAIDRSDLDTFADLATDRRQIVICDDYLPEFWQTRLFGRRIWITPYGPPVRGWIFQQIAKLAVVATLPEPCVVLIDSDAVLLRPIPTEAVLRDGRTRLYRVPGQADQPSHHPWYRFAAKALGLPPADYLGADYITTLMTWRPSVVRALLQRIRATTRLPWRMALSWQFRFSECILYGAFCDHVAGPHQDEVFEDAVNLCHCSWYYDLSQDDGRRAFAAGVTEQHAAVVLQSNLSLPEPVRAALLDAVEDAAKASP